MCANTLLFFVLDTEGIYMVTKQTKHLTTSKKHDEVFNNLKDLNEEQRILVENYITTLERKIMGLEQTNQNLSLKVQRHYENLY